jgi:phosphoribosyl-ATP pyrophosphohydrolase/phosphoribosyl-AMP cyclohydrolase
MSNVLTPLKFDGRGLIPAILQDADTGQVLMLAWMNADALARTRATGEAWFWSRSRQELWRKGATSGHTMRVASAYYDCDGDALLLKVYPSGPACHTGEVSCFYRVLEEQQSTADAESEPVGAHPFFLSQLFDVIADRRAHPRQGSYTSALLAEGLPKIAQKVGEEAAEVLVAALSQEDRRLVEEVADLTYHVLVLLAARGLSLQAVLAELALRAELAQRQR